MTLEIGKKAPDFTLPSDSGKDISLHDYEKQKVILYFYPKDNTPGCTAQACNLNENLDLLNSQGFEVIGVSPDSVASHQNFVSKFGLKFTLLADTEKKISNLYGVWGEKKNYGKVYMGIHRTTFIIDEKGVIEEAIEKVDTKKHTLQIVK